MKSSTLFVPKLGPSKKCQEFARVLLSEGPAGERPAVIVQIDEEWHPNEWWTTWYGVPNALKLSGVTPALAIMWEGEPCLMARPRLVAALGSALDGWGVFETKELLTIASGRGFGHVVEFTR